MRDRIMAKSNVLSDVLFRARNKRMNAKKLTRKPGGIYENQYMTVGGIDQWVTIRGEDPHNPILLFVHGGPGSPYSMFNPLITSWEKDFTLVQWDQRGAGKTFGKNKMDGSGTLTFDKIAKDGIELVENLCSTLNQQKIILIGSSLGSVIGMLMIRQRPDLFWTYVGTDQNAPDPHFEFYEVQKKALLQSKHIEGVHLLERMGRDPQKWQREDFDKLNQYLVKSIDQAPNMIMDLFLPSLIASPEHTIKDIFDMFKGMDFSLHHLYDELMSLDFETRVGFHFDIPIFIFQGEYDILSPTKLAEKYFAHIQAPHKEFVLIKQAGHLACFANPDQFYKELIQRVLPFTKE